MKILDAKTLSNLLNKALQQEIQGITYIYLNSLSAPSCHIPQNPDASNFWTVLITQNLHDLCTETGLLHNLIRSIEICISLVFQKILDVSTESVSRQLSINLPQRIILDQNWSHDQDFCITAWVFFDSLRSPSQLHLSEICRNLRHTLKILSETV